MFTIMICITLNGAGCVWRVCESRALCDEIADSLTPFVLVAIVAEIIYRNGGDDEFFDTPRHAIVTGAVIGLVGAAGWEGIEMVLSAMGVPISNALADSIFDVVLGVLGGAAGAYVADRFLDRLFGRSRLDSNRPRVR